MPRLILLTLLIAPAAHSHPHEWINYLVTPEINANGEITALNERWEFDPLSAEMIMEPILTAGTEAERTQKMHELQTAMNRTIAAQHYYTFTPAPQLAPAENISLSIENDALHYRLRIPLKKPTKKLSYRIYEPSYFIEMRYDAAQQRQFDHGCTLTITETNPSPELIAAAYAIDKNGKSEADLGKHFAQQSELTCP